MTDINALSRELYANAREKGFYEHEDTLRKSLARSAEVADRLGASQDFQESHLRTQLAEHYGNRLLLIAGEAVEAHEEVRGGHGVAELYFSVNGKGEYSTPTHPEEQYLLKPEGVLAELADVAIRTLETMQSILDQASHDEAAKLRGQVPESDATDYTVDAMHNRAATQAAEPVNVAEVILLKHRFNLSRAPKHGGKAF